MTVTVQELNKKVAEIKSLKMLKEETEEAIKALENEVISFLQETEECETTDKKGNPIRQYIGTDYKAPYSSQSRETVDRAAVKEILSDEQYQKVSKVSTYNVLRIK